MVALAALGIYFWLPHPIHDQETLKAVAAESQRLMAAHKTAQGWVSLPKNQWTPAIARLKPYSVKVGSRIVDITTKPYFDGGWGYGFTRNKQDLGMLQECWSDLGQDVYWHGPC